MKKESSRVVLVRMAICLYKLNFLTKEQWLTFCTKTGVIIS